MDLGLRLQKSSEHFTMKDWYTNTWTLGTKSDLNLRDSHKLRHIDRQLRNDTGIQDRWDNYRNNQKLKNRLIEVDNWRDILQRTLEIAVAEIAALAAAKNETERALEGTNLPLEIANENLTVREGRKGVDLTHDQVEDELNKEVALITEVRRLLQIKGQEGFEQLLRLQDIRLLLQADINDKICALDIDDHVLDSNTKSRNVTLKMDSTRLPSSMVTPEAWEDMCRYHKARADEEITSSRRLREAMHYTIEKCRTDTRTQRNTTNFRFRNRIHETEKAINDEKYQIKRLEEEIAETIKEIKCLEDSYASRLASLKVCETRLEQRLYRPNMELCRDDPHMGLREEHRTLVEAMKKLQDKLDQTREKLNALEDQLFRVKDDLRNKEEALTLDLRSMQRRHAMKCVEKTPWDETDRNIVLSSTVPVKEEYMKQHCPRPWAL